MGILDIIFLIIFAFAVYKGYKSGFVVELCGILGVILGVWVAYMFSERIFDFFGVSDGVGRIVGYIVIVLAVLLCVGILAKLVSRVLDFTGLGIANRLLGSIASLVKTIIILSVFVMIFDTLNVSMHFVKRSDIDKSSIYIPMMKVSATVFPFLGSFGDYINSGIKAVTDSVSSGVDGVKGTVDKADTTLRNMVDSVVLTQDTISEKNIIDTVKDFFDNNKKDTI